MFSSKKWEECSLSSPWSNLRKLCIIIIFVTLGYVPFVLACLSTIRLCSPACPRAVCARLPVHVPFVLVCLSTCRLCSPACPLTFHWYLQEPFTSRMQRKDVRRWMCQVGCATCKKMQSKDVRRWMRLDVRRANVWCGHMHVYFQIHDLFAMNALLLQTWLFGCNWLVQGSYK